jgi:hypothetical protein
LRSLSSTEFRYGDGTAASALRQVGIASKEKREAGFSTALFGQKLLVVAKLQLLENNPQLPADSTTLRMGNFYDGLAGFTGHYYRFLLEGIHNLGPTSQLFG